MIRIIVSMEIDSELPLHSSDPLLDWWYPVFEIAGIGFAGERIDLLVSIPNIIPLPSTLPPFLHRTLSTVVAFGKSDCRLCRVLPSDDWRKDIVTTQVLLWSPPFQVMKNREFFAWRFAKIDGRYIFIQGNSWLYLTGYSLDFIPDTLLLIRK